MNERLLQNREATFAQKSQQCTFFQDEKLKRLVEIHGERWDFIASHFADRADVQCQHRWQKVVNPELVKGPWTKEEDERVVELVGKYGPKR